MGEKDEIWSERANKFGRRCVMNLGYGADAFEAETYRQQEILFPVICRELTAPPRLLLDFGCGYGRLTRSLALATKAARTLGYDACAELIALAPDDRDAGVEYVSGSANEFLERWSGTFDLVWIHQVLGGIADEQLPELTALLISSLREGGLLCVVENTVPNDPVNTFWRNRKARDYESLFAAHGLPITTTHTYPDEFEAEITAFVGRK